MRHEKILKEIKGLQDITRLYDKTISLSFSSFGLITVIVNSKQDSMTSVYYLSFSSSSLSKFYI